MLQDAISNAQSCSCYTVRWTKMADDRHMAWSWRDAAYVRCPSCDERAVTDVRRGTLRLTCAACGYSASGGRAEVLPSFEAYDAGNTPFGARLWLEARCCGGNRLWALNERHLDYLEAYVAAKRRTAAFPSPPGDRQLADKLPAWMKAAKHREELLRAIARLRGTL